MISYLLMVSAIAGLLVPALVRGCFSKGIDWTKQLSSPSWDFTRSWASNMTAAGTILSYGVLLSCVAPNVGLHVLQKRETYLSIAAIAGGLSVLAPLAFNVMSRILQAGKVSAACAIAFLLGAAITICGLILQLFIGACLVWELYTANTLPEWVAVALVLLVLTFSCLLVWYAALTAADTLKRESTAAPGGVEREVQLQASTPKSWALL